MPLADGMSIVSKASHAVGPSGENRLSHASHPQT